MNILKMLAIILASVGVVIFILIEGASGKPIYGLIITGTVSFGLGFSINDWTIEKKRKGNESIR